MDFLEAIAAQTQQTKERLLTPINPEEANEILDFVIRGQVLVMEGTPRLLFCPPAPSCYHIDGVAIAPDLESTPDQLRELFEYGFLDFSTKQTPRIQPKLAHLPHGGHGLFPIWPALIDWENSLTVSFHPGRTLKTPILIGVILRGKVYLA